MKPHKIVVLSAAAAVAGLAYWFATGKPARPPTPPQPVASAPVSAETAVPASNSTPAPAEEVPDSEYAQCRELGALYHQMHKKLGCANDNWAFGKAICEAPFKAQKDCVDELEAAITCIEGETEAGWSCDGFGKLVLKESTCPAPTRALRDCLTRK